MASALRKCIRCGIEFTPEGNWHQRNRQITCTQQCRALYERSRVDAVIGEGKPLVTVHSDHVQCNICGETLAFAGRHLASMHLVALGKRLTISERQIIYGFTQGQRTVPEKYLEQMRERGLTVKNQAHMLRMRGLKKSTPSECPPHLVKAPRSPLQLEHQESIRNHENEAFWAGASGYLQEKKAKALVTLQCISCGKEFARPQNVVQGGRKKTCSPECRRAYLARLNRERGANLSQEQREHRGRIVSEARRAKSYIVPIACKGCGTVFRPSYSGRVYCSMKCRSLDPSFGTSISNAKRRLADIACAVCGTVFRPSASKVKCCSYACGSILATKIRRTRRSEDNERSPVSQTIGAPLDQ